MSIDRDPEVSMKSSDFAHNASDGKSVFVRRWLPTGNPKAILLVAHGMADHSARYERLAEVMTAVGWSVYAPDLRGHGRTAAPGELGWFAERDGFSRIRDDLHEVALVALSQNQGLPLFFLGHSMGSLLAEVYLAAYGRELAGCVLSGVLSPPTPLLLASGTMIMTLGLSFKGQKVPATMLHGMSFESNNKDFEPSRTKMDWLSRDTAEVDKYVADPLCGFICSFGLYRDFLAGFTSIYRRGAAFSGLPKALPLFIVAGAEDPLGGAKGFVSQLAEKFKTAGLQDIETRLYPGARHDILHETNRDEVLSDIKGWLESKLGNAQA
jgi:alpha-beta hydrolase superfamily lysophospholipase